MPLALARIHQFSMSRVMPRSWPTTMPGVMTSTSQPRSASSSATEVAWWKPISSTTTTLPSGCARPVSTSRTSTIQPEPSTWSAGTQYGGATTAPVATTTVSGARRSTSSAVASTPYSTWTPRRAHSWTWLRTRSPSSARFGTDAARRTWPPASCSRSRTVTWWPLRAAAIAACRPAGPAPTTSTRRPRVTGRASPTPSDSRPVRGFSMQPSQRFSPMRPTHSWLQDRHRRVSSVKPPRALRTKSASAIWPRTTPTRSHCPSCSARSAWSGSLNRPTPTTGRSTAWRSAEGMNIA